MTFLDRVDKFVKDYISRSDIVPINEPDDTVFKADDYGEESKKWNPTGKMTPVRRRELALISPLFMKATKKKNLDIFRAWFEFENINTNKPLSAVDKKIIELFDAKTNPKFKFLIAGISADIYGDGFIIKKYSGDWKNKDGTIDFTKPPKGKLSNLEIINPEYLKEFRYLEGKEGKKYEKMGIQHYFYKNQKTGLEMFIHPKRIIHVKDDQLPFAKLGISKVDMLRYIIVSEKDIDIATGEILKWFSHGVQEFTKIGMQPNERKEILKIMAQHPNYYANDDRYKLKIHNPTAIDPREFYNYIILMVASVFVMPMQVLTGVQIGKVTGAETGYSDYYRDVKDKQDLIYSPLLVELYKEVLGNYGQLFKYEIVWNDIFVGELAEAELIGKRAATVQILMQTNPPVISPMEAREIMNKGKTYLEPDKLPKVVKQDSPLDKKGDTLVRKEKPAESEKAEQAESSYIPYDKYQDMIEKRKRIEQAKGDKALGKLMEEEQDKIFGKKEKKDE